MLAVFVNMATVLLGSAIGILFRKKIRENIVSAVICALALVTILIGITSAIDTADILCIIICMALGTIIGELIRIDDAIEGAGDFIKSKLLKGKGSGRFTEGFITACIVFCVGSMTIMGSFEAGINSDYSIIFAKSALDFVSATMFAAAMGLGVPFSALFILVFQGGLTLLAGVLSPYLSPVVVTEMSAVGGVILMGMGINMLELSPKRIKVANMLPAVFLPIAYIPIAQFISNIIK
ncbi:MAG: DUF554 domain-containing protein [Oscillospiraceae bacterium]|nr:DUF554 domain-containing protein [Oscillospiraceae bacterium]